MAHRGVEKVVRQRALFTGRCIAPTLGGASGVQQLCSPVAASPPHWAEQAVSSSAVFLYFPHHNPHHTQRQLTKRVDLPTRLWRTEVWRRSCGSELCSLIAASPPHGRSKQRSAQLFYYYASTGKPHHTQRQHTRRADFPTYLRRTQV